MTCKSGSNIKWLCSPGELSDRWDIKGLGKVLQNMKTWDNDSLGYYERKQCKLWLHAAHTTFLIK